MADFLARNDPEDGYVYLTNTGGYDFPDDLFRLLKQAPYAGVHSREIRGELRFEQRAARAAIDRLRREGHRIHTLTGPRSRAGAPAREALECHDCGRPYPTGRVAAPEELCAAPIPGYSPHRLRLVNPHRLCGPDCHAAALEARKPADTKLTLARSVDDA